MKSTDQLFTSAIRILSADSVERANSGHPGMPLGMADIAFALWQYHLRHNPLNPKWLNRDRFVLSNGHGSMLLYSLLHLSGYSLSIDDLKSFRRIHSKTPGHPEYGYTEGVETTTGPLGQGLANAIGMAIAEQHLSSIYNKPNFTVVDHYTYAFVGDGCLMEGISHEACSLAGTLKLGKLIVFYDDNGISIDGEVKKWFNEDVVNRFKAYHWHVIEGIDGHSVEAINQAIVAAKNNSTMPSILICKTKIGYGCSANKLGKESVHGAPLGANEVAALRENLNWQYPPFVIPQEVYDKFDARQSGEKHEQKWQELFNQYRQQFPELASQLMRTTAHQLPANWQKIVQNGISQANDRQESIATRKSSAQAIAYYADYLPELIGGSADLTHSNLTSWPKSTLINNGALMPEFSGNYISYGVREFAMSAIMNGMFLHGGIRPFGGTFLMFSEYARNALRMASLMQIAPIFVYSHDSIGLGEDGPTHQAVEQLATLRVIPNMQVWRPCDNVETMVAWAEALSNTKCPTCLVLSRQNLPYIKRDSQTIANIKKGGYIIKHNQDGSNHQSKQCFDIVLIATGSEVTLALSVYEALLQHNKDLLLQVVSMPSTNAFDKQCTEYKQQVLPAAKLKVAIEAGVSDSWYKYVGINTNSLIIAQDCFGESGTADDLFKHFGFTVENIIKKINSKIAINNHIQESK